MFIKSHHTIKKLNFGQRSKSWSKIQNLSPKFNFWSKLEISVELNVFVKIAKISIYLNGICSHHLPQEGQCEL